MSGVVTAYLGTKHGLHAFTSRDRREWTAAGSWLDGEDVSAFESDRRDGAFYAATTTGVFRSDDAGTSWRDIKRDLPMKAAWQITSGHRPGEVWLGGEPAVLYHSLDRGETWTPVEGLNSHPTRKHWQPGGGGLIVHTILLHPDDPADVDVAISVAGFLHSSDGGLSFEVRNAGLPEFAGPDDPREKKDVSQCVHKVVRHPARPELLFQQNHVNVWRSADHGRSWGKISDGLPTTFGFPIGILKSAPHSIFVIPGNDASEQAGPYIAGQLAVYRSDDEGASWKRLTRGLPEVEKLNVYRDGMWTDALPESGVYFGTSAGVAYCSTDRGESWQVLADGLAGVRCVRVAES
jgi:photosystem II stability/assembly factor-like uncharacterized protein